MVEGNTLPIALSSTALLSVMVRGFFRKIAKGGRNRDSRLRGGAGHTCVKFLI